MRNLAAGAAAVEEEHADPGSVCYSCHVMLDPMRNYFANEFEPTYRARQSPGTGGLLFSFTVLLLYHRCAG